MEIRIVESQEQRQKRLGALSVRDLEQRLSAFANALRANPNASDEDKLALYLEEADIAEELRYRRRAFTTKKKVALGAATGLVGLGLGLLLGRKKCPPPEGAPPATTPEGAP